jgi:hypothetical protein
MLSLWLAAAPSLAGPCSKSNEATGILRPFGLMPEAATINLEKHGAYNEFVPMSSHVIARRSS